MQNKAQHFDSVTDTDLSRDMFNFFKCKADTYIHNEYAVEDGTGKKLKSTKIYQVNEPYTADTLEAHLSGAYSVGVCPIVDGNKAYFGAIDIDTYNNDYAIQKVVSAIYKYALPLLPFRSKSGGLHIYFVAPKAAKASTIVDFLMQVVSTFGWDCLFDKKHIEYFPKQTHIEAGGFGNGLTLPYYNAFNGDVSAYLWDKDCNAVSFEEFVKLIKRKAIGFMSLKDAQTLLKSLPYNDAPPCLQAIILQQAIGDENGGGRNNFLFSLAIYYSKKDKDLMRDKVYEINRTFEFPLPDSEVETIIQSVESKVMNYHCDDIPCAMFCNKSVCAKREFGKTASKKNAHFSNIEFGQMYRILAEEPYYQWDLRVDGSDKPFKKVTFKDEYELLNQKVFLRQCVRYLNTVPAVVTQNDWNEIVTKSLETIKEIKIDISSDVSGTALIKKMFVNYISSNICSDTHPYLVNTGMVYRSTGKVYFTLYGFAKYLNNQKVAYNGVQLREIILAQGAEPTVLMAESYAGNIKEVSCLMLDETRATVATALTQKTETDLISRLAENQKEVTDGITYEDLNEADDAQYLGEEYDRLQKETD